MGQTTRRTPSEDKQNLHSQLRIESAKNMKITVMTADEQIVTLEIDRDESVTTLPHL